MLIVALAAGLLMQFFPCCAFAVCFFSKVSATPDEDMDRWYCLAVQAWRETTYFTWSGCEGLERCCSVQGECEGA